MLTKIRADEIPRIGRSGRNPGWPMKTLEAFLASGDEAAKVSPREGVLQRTGYSSLVRARDRHGYPVQVIMRDDEIYLRRTDGDENTERE